MFTRYTFLIPATLLAILMALIDSRAPADEPHRVRVLTYNIHHGEGTDGALDLRRIANVIRRAAPDVVALQEVDSGTGRSQGVNQMTELARLTKMHGVFGKAMDYDGGQYGEAILSRHPIAEVRVINLPTTSGCEPRCVLTAQLRMGDDRPQFLFAATHLEHARATLRLCQAEKLSSAIAQASRLPAILAGDLNDVPESPTITVLTKHWTDATAANPTPTWPATDPKRKIDYVLFQSAREWRVVDARVIDEKLASDHCPLLVELEWVPQEAIQNSR